MFVYIYLFFQALVETCCKFVGDEKLSWQDLGKKAASQVNTNRYDLPARVVKKAFFARKNIILKLHPKNCPVDIFIVCADGRLIKKMQKSLGGSLNFLIDW